MTKSGHTLARHAVNTLTDRSHRTMKTCSEGALSVLRVKETKIVIILQHYYHNPEQHSSIDVSVVKVGLCDDVLLILRVFVIIVL